MDILILCTGNSCRSQMAEGFLKSFDKTLNVYSAGTNPAEEVHPLAIKVMREVGIDIGHNKPLNVKKFLNRSFDYLITVCDHAQENCPIFTGSVKKRLHIGFTDPAEAIGTDEEKISVFKKVRDQICHEFYELYCEITGKVYE